MSLPQRLPDPEFDDGSPEDDVEVRLHLAARREHSLQSLLELSRELTVALDLYETADLLLFNLMGQLGVARSALWLVTEDQPGLPVLVRVHGFQRSVIEVIGTSCGPYLYARFSEDPAPQPARELGAHIGSAEFELVRHAEVALFAPLHARGELLGWLALGAPVDGSAYAAAEFQVLEAARGMVAVSLQNARLYNRARESNRRLRATNEHLSELDRLKTEFVSNVNHELRTPLAVVLATIDAVVDRGDLEPRVRSMLETSLRQAQKLKGMIENLLMFSDVLNSRLPICAVPDEVLATLDTCVEDRMPGVTAGLRELVYRPPAGLPRAVFDHARLLQILNELIDNAIKFTPRGTRIELRARAQSANGGEAVLIEVADNGPGIPPARMGSLFSSFEQVDGSATRQVGGLGMGLAFAKKLADRMNCRLTAESEVGSGCVFRLLIPGA